MKFLCLAYGAEEDWLKLSFPQQQELLAHDDMLKKRGAVVSAVGSSVVTVTAWDGPVVTASETFSKASIPLAGFSIVEASNIEEASRLMADTPCARAKGVVEIRPFVSVG